MEKAINEGPSLAEVLGQAREALEPFGNHPDFHASDDWPVTFADASIRQAGVTAGDFRRARQALSLIDTAKPVDERAAVVAWLWRFGFTKAADAIKRGDHLQTTTDQHAREIAGRLTEAQRRAMMHREDASEACMSFPTAAVLYRLGLTSRNARFLRLTPLGLAVRRHLQQERPS